MRTHAEMFADVERLAAELKSLRHEMARFIPDSVDEEINNTVTEAGIIPLALLEKKAVLAALRAFPDDRKKVCRLLGIGKTTLYRKIEQWGWFAVRKQKTKQ
jgi:DNA-binding NtrC family response regulator